MRTASDVVAIMRDFPDDGLLLVTARGEDGIDYRVQLSCGLYSSITAAPLFPSDNRDLLHRETRLPPVGQLLIEGGPYDDNRRYRYTFVAV